MADASEGKSPIPTPSGMSEPGKSIRNTFQPTTRTMKVTRPPTIRRTRCRDSTVSNAGVSSRSTRFSPFSPSTGFVFAGFGLAGLGLGRLDRFHLGLARRFRWGCGDRLALGAFLLLRRLLGLLGILLGIGLGLPESRQGLAGDEWGLVLRGLVLVRRQVISAIVLIQRQVILDLGHAIALPVRGPSGPRP